MPQTPIKRSKPPRRMQRRQNKLRKLLLPRPLPPKLKLIKMLQRPMLKRPSLLKMPPRLKEMEIR